MKHVTHPLSSADISIFLPKISRFCYIKKSKYRFHLNILSLILLSFLESLRIFTINMVTILMMPAKMATPVLLKIKIFWKKFITSQFRYMTSPTEFYHVISNYNVNVVMWPRVCSSSISVREVIITSSFVRIWSEKILFLKGGIGSSSIIWDWH